MSEPTQEEIQPTEKQKLRQLVETMAHLYAAAHALEKLGGYDEMVAKLVAEYVKISPEAIAQTHRSFGRFSAMDIRIGALIAPAIDRFRQWSEDKGIEIEGLDEVTS